MDAHTHYNSQGMPREGEHVAFVLDGRDVVLHGTFTGQRFRSQWSRYEPARVRSWWPAPPDALPCGAVRHPA